MRFDFRPSAIPGVSGLTVTPGIKSYELKWAQTKYSVAVWASKTNNKSTATLIATVAGNTSNYTHITDGSVYYYWTQTLDSMNRATGAWNPSSSTGGLSSPPSVVGRVHISATSSVWSVGATGNALNPSITLVATLLGGITGFVTWSKTGAGTTPPAAGTTNSWTIYAADQTADSNIYTATITYGGVTYTDQFEVTRVRDGIKGDKGDQGQLGSLTGYGSAYGIVSTVWSDAVANRVISNMLAGESLTSGLDSTEHLLPGDTVTLGNNTSFTETRFWDGSKWADIGMIIDGNLLVKGSVTADKITSGSIQTGYNANARINIGDITFIGNSGTPITSPFHIDKISARQNQALITAKNTKDDAVCIWGSSVYNATYPNGNAVSGTWHASESDANAGNWSMIGLLGSKAYGAAVAGNVYGSSGTQFGAWFRSYNGANSGTPGSVVAEVKLATNVSGATRAIVATGTVQLYGGSSPLLLDSSAGTAGQVLTSAGPGATPTWTTASGGTTLTYSGLQAITSGTTGSALNLTTTFRSTGTNAPTGGAGVELAYYNGEGYVISGGRTAGGAISGYTSLKLQGSTISLEQASSITFNVTPTCPTPATATNSTAIATTAFVKAQGYSTVALGSTTPAADTASGSAGSAATAARSDHAHPKGDSNTVGGIKIKGGSATTAATASGASVTIATGLTSVVGFSATALDGYVAGISGVSGGSVTVVTRAAGGGALAGGAALRWVATGT